MELVWTETNEWKDADQAVAAFAAGRFWCWISAGEFRMGVGHYAVRPFERGWQVFKLVDVGGA